jgi:putative thioredoxin
MSPSSFGAGPGGPASAPFNTHGAVDLAALAAARAARERAEAAREEALRAAAAGEVGDPTTGPLVIDVTEASFQTDVMDRSMTVPVVIDFWAEWCGPCKQLSPVLEKLALEAAGAWVLVKIDTDANPRLAQAFGVQSIPVVFVVWQGQLVPGFTGAIPEAELRGFVGQVAKLSELAPPGSVGGPPGDGELDGSAGEDPAGSAGSDPADREVFAPLDPLEEAALDALDAGDLDAAVTSFEALVAAQPGNAEAKVGLARVQLLRRTKGGDPALARAAADAAPDDLAAQSLAADFDIAAGLVENAITRLVDLVRRTSGSDRDAARTQLLSVFALIGDDDPRVSKGRTALANALF